MSQFNKFNKPGYTPSNYFNGDQKASDKPTFRSFGQGPQFPQPDVTAKPSVIAYLSQFQVLDVFKRGKYKGLSFEDVFNNDVEYISYVILECKLEVMYDDKQKLSAWLDKRIKVSPKSVPTPVTQVPHLNSDMSFS